MSKRPRTPEPGYADDSIVVIVKRSNHQVVSALIITVMILAGVFWMLKGANSKAAVHTAPEDPKTQRAGAVADQERAFPRGTADITLPPSLTPSPSGRSFSRATFFEPTGDDNGSQDEP